MLNILNFKITNSNLFNNSCRAINRVGPQNLEIISVIFFLFILLLGDGYAKNRSGEGVRISVKQSILHKEYRIFI